YTSRCLVPCPIPVGEVQQMGERQQAQYSKAFGSSRRLLFLLRSEARHFGSSSSLALHKCLFFRWFPEGTGFNASRDRQIAKSKPLNQKKFPVGTRSTRAASTSTR